MRPSHICALLFFSGLALIACAGSMTDPGPGKRVQLAIARQSYQPGDTVSITVTNVSDVQLTYPGDYCPKELQRSEGGTWTHVSLPDSAQGCPLSVGTLGPHAQQSVSVPLPSELTTDTYRIALPAPTVDITNPNLAEPPLLTPEFTVNPHT